MTLRAVIVAVATTMVLGVLAPSALGSGVPPSTTISFKPQHPATGKVVYFNAYVDDYQDCTTNCYPPWDADPSEYYQWDFDEDGIYNEPVDDDIGLSAGGTWQAPAHLYSTPGTRLVRFRGKDVDDGLFGTSTTTVDVHTGNWPPTGDFRLATAIGYGCTTNCDFTARSGRPAEFEAFGDDPDAASLNQTCGPLGEVISRDVDHFAWDFNGDGIYNSTGDEYDGTPDSPVRTWPASDSAQSYLVRLRLTDADGGQTIVAHTVLVAASSTNLAPNVTVSASPSSPTTTATEVRFSLSAWDHDGSLPQDAAHIAWDFDEDGVFGDSIGAGTLIYARHYFDSPGEKTVRVRVTDEDARTATAAVTVHVARPSSAPLSPRMTAPYAAVVGNPVGFSGRTFTGATYNWDLNGDGIFGDATARDPSWTYGVAGDVLVRVRITIPGTAPVSDRTGEAAAVVHVDTFNPPPRVWFSMSHDTSSPCGVMSFRGLAAKALTFGSNASDADTTGVMPDPTWDWHGDETFGDDLGGGWPLGPLHTFSDPGNPLVLERVSDALGAVTVTGHSIEIHAANQPPTASMSPNASYSYVGAGQSTMFSATNVSDDSSVVAYAWDLDDDGAFDDGAAQSVNYNFATAGTHTVRLRVTDDDGLSMVDTETINVRAAPPANQAPPTISGQPTIGQTLTASPGTWSGTPPITYGYQWQRCDSTATMCSDVGGAIGTTYELTAADDGARIRVAVTADNSAPGIAGPVYSAATVAVGVALSSNDDATITGGSDPPLAGETLTANPGTWTRAPTFSYQWQVCEPDGTGCVDFGGGTDPTLQLGSSVVGKRIRVVITGTLGSESDTTIAGPTGVVQPSPPVNSEAPSITGTLRDGQTLTASAGTWSGQPSFAYQWERCTGGECAAIAAATEQDYGLVPADVGTRLRVVVAATNDYGRQTAASGQTGEIQAIPVAVDQIPLVTGKARDGQILVGTPAKLTGTPPITVSNLWQRCDADGENCTAIVGAGDTEYELVAADVGKRIRLRSTGLNLSLPGGGSTAADSLPTAVVEALPAHYVSGARITGAASPLLDTGTLSADPGVWTGSTPIGFTYSWQRCDAAGGSCSMATGESLAPDYQLNGLDAGHTLRVLITGSNATLPNGGSDHFLTAASALVEGTSPPFAPPQPPTTTPPPPPPPAPAPPAAPSGTDAARANIGAVAKDLARLRLARLIKTGSFRTSVTVPGASLVKVDVLLRKTKVATGSKAYRSGGKYALVVKLSKRGKAALTKLRKARLTVQVTVTTGGIRTTAQQAVTVKR